MGKAIEEVKERAALLERRLEHLTDSLSRVFTRLERLEDRLDDAAQGLNRQSRKDIGNNQS